MQTRRDWLRSSLGIGGMLLVPHSILSAQEKEAFNPRSLEPIIRLSSNENPYGPSKGSKNASKIPLFTDVVIRMRIRTI